jgi:hypothetical protein
MSENEKELAEAWHLLNVLSANMMDDGPTWPRVIEWLERNEKCRPTNLFPSPKPISAGRVVR